jgi:hypothetical protein
MGYDITMTADRNTQFGELLERHRAIVFKVPNTCCRMRTIAPTWRRRLPRSCGVRFRLPTPRARFRPGCTASH